MQRECRRMLSQRGRYALKAMTYLARTVDTGPKQLAAIAASGNIPPKYLEKVMGDLRKAGLVTSARGRYGGYTLARAPAETMFGEIMRVTDGPIALISCVSQSAYRRCEDCPNEEKCQLHGIMSSVRDEVSAILDTTSLAAIIADANLI